MAVDNVSSTSKATDRGTQVVKNGNTMDKNAFLKILVAELSNQNPENATDSTQYVAQLAQFSSLEQMNNLNSTMSLTGAASLIGTKVTLNTLNSDGVQYSGLVKNVTKKDDGSIVLGVEVEENGSSFVKDFLYSDVQQVSYNNTNV